MNSKILSASLSLLFSVVISGCGGGGGGDTDTTAQGTTDTVIALQTITGGATKGPLTNANVAVYSLSFDGGPVLVSSTAVDTGTTSSQAKIQDLALPFPLNPPYLLKFTATASTKDLSTCTNPADLTTCFAPILNTMSTVITSEMLAAGQNIYATPLTAMATNIALQQAATDATQFKTNLSTAAMQVTSTLGFGMSSRIDIFNTPPLVDETTDTADELGDTASYRSAIEAVGAVVYQMQQNSTAADASEVLDELSNDLAADGIIDGQTASGTSSIVTTNTLQVLDTDPANLPIPNTTKTVSDVTTDLDTETASTGSTTDTTALATIVVVVEPAETSTDIDNDGVLNVGDAYPEDPTADKDTDGDGAPDIAYTDASRANEDTARSDADDDNDGWLDTEDDYTTDVTRFLNPDLDRDNDTVANGIDNCPLTGNTDQADTDGNGHGDACSNDNDGDGIDDGADNCPLVANPSQTDTGGSTDGDACDINIDGDSADNTVDAFPYDAGETIDTDGDGIGNNADTDDDNDGLQDTVETNTGTYVDASDTGSNPLIRDTDADGYLDGVDLNPVDDTVTVNFAPVANIDTATTDEDSLVSITVLTNDTDSNTADTLTVTAVGTASNGTVAINGNNVDYTPATDFNGTDSFSYTVSDGTVTATATVTVTVNAVNDAPVVGAAGPFSISENVANAFVVGSVTATDVDGSISGYSITAGNTGSAFAISAAGQITVADTTAVDYETATSFSLSITATDGVNTSVAETVVVNITDVNDTAPVVGAAGPFSIAEDVADITVVGSVTATDADSSVIGYSITGGNTGTAFAISAAGVISVADTTAIDYESATSFSLSITATDGVNTSAAQSVVVDISDVNDTAPVVSAAGPFMVAENVANATVVGSVTATDADSSVTGYSISGGNTASAFAISAAGVISVADTTAIDYEATTSFTLTITATDGVNTSVAQSVVVNISDVNDTAPVVSTAGPFTVAENVANATVVGNVTATDVDGSVTGYSISGGNTGSAFAISAAGQITVADTTAIDYESATSFTLTITATDGVNTSAAQSVVVNISDVNDTAPVVAAGQSFNVIETATNGTVIGTVSASDADSIGGITGFSISGTVFAIDASGQITVADNTTLLTASPHTVTVGATDGVNTSAAVSVIITAVSNQLPVISQTGPLSVTMDEDSSPQAFVAPAITATDAEADPLNWSTTGASNGTATVTGTGASPSISYVPDANHNGSDSFVVNVSDGTSTVGITVDVTINPTNDAPVANVDGATTDEDTLVIIADVMTNDTDVDGDILSVTAADLSSVNGGVVTNNGDGTFDYTPPNNHNGSDSFSYTVSDGNDTATASVTITINPVNDAPITTNDPVSTSLDTPVTTGNVLANDTDIESDTLTIVAGNPTATNGTVVNHNDGTFTYTPNTGYTGMDSFTYSVSDGALTSTGTVTIDVAPPGTLIPTATLLDTTGVDGGVGGLEDADTKADGSIAFEYWTDAYNASASQLVFDDKRYNYTTSQYESITGIHEDLILTNNGWVRFDSIDAQADGSNNLDITLRDASSAAIATFNITARFIDISGQPMASYLDLGWDNGLIDPAADFSANAKEIVDLRWKVTGADQYWLGEHFDCQEWNPTAWATLNGNCNAVELSMGSNTWATLLTQIVAASAWVDPNDGSALPGGIQIAHNWVNNSSLYVELVSDNSTNYYVVDHNSGDWLTPVAGTAWRTSTVMTEALYEFDIPSQFATDFPDDVRIEEGLTYFVTLQNGFVRQGQIHDLNGYESENGMLNAVALNDILANHDPVKALGYNYVNLVGGTAYDVYYDSSLTSWCIDQIDVLDASNMTLGDYGITACDGTSASSGPASYSVDSVTGIMMVDDGVDAWYRKVVGYKSAYNAKEVCSSLSSTGPWDCVEGDAFFGYETMDSVAAEYARDALNNPPPAYPFPDAATLAGTTIYNVYFCDDPGYCTTIDWTVEQLVFDADGSTFTIIGAETYVGTYNVINGILEIYEDGYYTYIQIMSVDGASSANRSCWVDSGSQLTGSALDAALAACDGSLGDEFMFDNVTDANDFQASMTFTAGATVDATALLAGGIYEFWDDSWDGTTQVLAYWTLSVNGSTIVDTDYIWSRALHKFLPESNVDIDIMLTTSGWQQGDDNISDAVISSNQATLNIRAPDNELVQSLVVTFEAMDISGREIGLYAPHTMLDNVSAIFSSGAQQIKETATASQDYIALHFWEGCADYATWGNNCNVVWRRQMTGTDVATPLNAAADVSFIDAVGATIELGQHNYSGSNGTSLLGVFSGSIINYYTVNWDAGTTAVDTGVVGAFTASTINGEYIIEYTVPTTILNYDQFNLFYDTEETETGILAVHNNYLRHGDKQSSIATNTWLDLNSVAANDVFNEQPVTPPLYGSWVVSGWTDTTTAPDIISFFADGKYMHSGTCDDTSLSGSVVTNGLLGPETGIYDAAPELGTYSWDSATNAFTGSTVIDANGWCGLGDTFAGAATASVSGDVMTITDTSGSFILNRVTTDTSPIVGSWVLADPNDPVVFTFFANGKYNESQTCSDHETFDGVSTYTPEPIDGGIEYGSYTWDEGNTYVLSGNVVIDTDGWCGIHSTNDAPSTTAGGFTVTIDGDVMTAVIPGESDVIFYRVQ